ncbi:hypothetical protein [Nonomuraea roseoviolacea]
MGRYQCPLCQGLHRSEDQARCPVHGMGYSPRCQQCRHVAVLTPCGGGR